MRYIFLSYLDHPQAFASGHEHRSTQKYSRKGAAVSPTVVVWSPGDAAHWTSSSRQDTSKPALGGTRGLVHLARAFPAGVVHLGNS